MNRFTKRFKEWNPRHRFRNQLKRVVVRVQQWIQHPVIQKLIQVFQHWIHPWITRANGVYLLGCLLLVQGAKYEWYHLPPDVSEAFHTSQFWLQDPPRYVVATFVGIGFLWLLWKRPKIIPCLPYWGGLLATLLFPFVLATWHPTVTFLATAYHDQNLEVVRHVEKRFPDVQAQWKQNIAFDQTKPISSIFAFKIEDRTFFQFSNWERVVLDGFGYRNAIFDFVGKGWGLTVSGFTMSLIGVHMQHRHQALQILHKDMKNFVPLATVLLGTIVIFLIGVNLVHHQVVSEMGQGHYATVTRQSRWLSKVYPPLKGDEIFLRRWAIASLQSGQPNDALVSFEKGCERYRAQDFFNAKPNFEAALEKNPNLFLARSYLASAWINEAVEYFKTTDRPKLPVYTVSFPKRTNFMDSPQAHERANVLRASGAVEQFSTALLIFPNHIAALYNLMLAYTVAGDFEAAARTAQQHIEVQKVFQKTNVALLGQSYLHQTWADYHADEMDAAWQRYRQSRNSKSWGETIERSESSESSE